MRKIKTVNEYESRTFCFIFMFIQFVMNSSAASGKSEIRTSRFVIHFCHSIDFCSYHFQGRKNMLTKRQDDDVILPFVYSVLPANNMRRCFSCNAATKFSAAVIAICCLVFNVADPICGKVTTFCKDKSGLSFESALV